MRRRFMNSNTEASPSTTTKVGEPLVLPTYCPGLGSPVA